MFRSPRDLTPRCLQPLLPRGRQHQPDQSPAEHLLTPALADPERGRDNQGAAPKIRDQERTLAERLISELSGTEFTPENCEDEYCKRVLKAIEQKVAGEEIERVEIEAPPPTTDLIATLKASPGGKELAKARLAKSAQEPGPPKRPVRRRRAS